MITAKDIHRKKFEQVKFGYNPEEVEAFLAEVEQDFRLMEQQLSDSNDKVQLLADKVREYKDTEEDLRNALVGAQKQAREVIEAAKARAAQIEAEARTRGDSVKAEAIVGQEEQLQSLEGEIAERQQELAALTAQAKEFRQLLLNAYKTHLKQIAQIPSAPVSEEPAVKPVETAAPTAKPVETVAPAAKPVEAAAPAAKPVEAVAPAAKPVETVEPAEKPVETVEPAAKSVEAVEPAAKPVETIAPESKPAEKPAKPEEKAAPDPEALVSRSSALINDPFAAEDAEKLRRNEMQFGSRRDEKRRRR